MDEHIWEPWDNGPHGLFRRYRVKATDHWIVGSETLTLDYLNTLEAENEDLLRENANLKARLEQEIASAQSDLAEHNRFAAAVVAGAWKGKRTGSPWEALGWLLGKQTLR